MNLTDSQLEWLCDHLGHTKKVHLKHYRQMSGLIERTQIAKLMLMQDLNLTKHSIGKKLDEVDIQGKMQTGYVTFNWSVIIMDSIHLYDS